MKTILIAGVSIVQLALLSYTVAIILQTRKLVFSRGVLTFLTLGVLFDIVSTVCMIISSGKGISIHGFIGYASLAGMLADTVLSYRHIHKYGLNSPVPKPFNRWSLAAYGYWVVAYLTGAVIVIMK